MKSPQLFWRIAVYSLNVFHRKRTALASFPRSGNTWLRFMIEEATGLRSGSIYRDRVLPRGRRGVVIKTHALDAFAYTHAVHLIRNPFDAISSYFHWRRDIGQEVVSWEEHLHQAAREWRRHTEYWLTVKTPVFRLKYESLLRDPAAELRNILNWLDFDVSEDRIATAVAHATLQNMRALTPQLGEKFFRQGEAGRSVSQFSPADRDVVAATLNDLLKQLDYCAPEAF